MTGLAWLTLLPLLVPASTGGDEARTREADMRKLDQWIDLQPSFTDERRHEAHAAVAAHLAQGKQFTDPELYMEVRRIVALADNGHSNADVTPIHQRFGLLPLRTFWFSDGLYVVRAREPQRKILGARIVGVEGRPIGELEARLKAYCAGT